MSNFADYFAGVANHYADSRPSYPAALFEWLAAACKTSQTAWDCGTGSGQAALDLAAHFQQVIATDASAAQLQQAASHPRIEYRHAPAEASGLASASVDVVTVAQALHWFDVEAFYREVRRVLKPGGLIAVWTYGVFHTAEPQLNAPLHDFYYQKVGNYWPAERRHVETHYRELAFPFQPVTTPKLTLDAEWTLPQLLGYLRSWSAVGKYCAAHGIDPVATLETQLRAAWGDAQNTRRIEWPLTLLAGRV